MYSSGVKFVNNNNNNTNNYPNREIELNNNKRNNDNRSINDNKQNDTTNERKHKQKPDSISDHLKNNGGTLGRGGKNCRQKSYHKGHQ